MPAFDFRKTFETLTGVSPFPWQEALYSGFISGRIPESARIPTGLGKTSVVAIWLIALARHPDRLPRRLVYVVNRRTVVDQTTTEVERLRSALMKQELADLRASLASLYALPLPTSDSPPLSISTLRGQFADNGEWCADPSRPAVIVGTVDMIGSGLLFSRYTRGFKTRPLHAGLLGQDSLLIHDESHLEPSFQKLLESIVAAQKVQGDSRKLKIVELTATSRAEDIAGEPPLTLTKADLEHETVNKRFNAIKRLALVALETKDKLEKRIVQLAEHASGERAILVFSRSVENAMKIAAALDKGERKGQVAMLTGTMRGNERDELATHDPVFQRFLPENDRAEGVAPTTGTVFLVATSAGEVGVNISADDLVCDLTSYESMAQRFGRVNRFGKRDDSNITVVHETKFDTSKQLETARERTLALLRELEGNASPAALEELPTIQRTAAFSPAPERRIATEIQFDAWALTSIRKPIAARPPVEPYLHGEAEWQPPETHLAWRHDWDFQYIPDPEAFLDEFPLKPSELLRDTTTRIVKTLGSLLSKRPTDKPDLPDAWLLSENGSVSRFNLSSFDKDTAATALSNTILLLPASLGGLSKGLFNAADGAPARDVSEVVRHLSKNGSVIPSGHRLVHAVEITEEDADEQICLYFLKRIPESAAVRSSQRETLADHTTAVVANAAAIAAQFFPTTPAVPDGEPDLHRCIVVAAQLHDLGKNRAQWQQNIGNHTYDPTKPETILAKSDPGMRPRSVVEHYRHEFGSLNDANASAEFTALNEDEQDIVLHLVATHHGRARPHFPHNEIFDYSAGENGPEVAFEIATEIPRRFARLQNRFGRWGLAWLESILRAADYAASAGIVVPGEISTYPPNQRVNHFKAPKTTDAPSPAVTLAVNTANPGHYFACCGILELASRLDPLARGWFSKEGSAFNLAFVGTSVDQLIDFITSAEVRALDPKEPLASPLLLGPPFLIRLDWWQTTAPATASLKTWSGQMKCQSICIAMQNAIREERHEPTFAAEKLLSYYRVAYITDGNKAKKVEPFYFDANRGPNAHSRDVGFAPNDLGLETIAAPASELLCLIGLQRAIPSPADKPRLFRYHLWHEPLPASILASSVNGLLPDSENHQFCFESWFRDGQHKNKAFLTARAAQPLG
ncbi:MAG: type I-G CRISPR-associated helicase/endonuclease Cas3g [Verrucomicrobiota bacterium JB025]|nr:type I-U CRISPR-associated helicase/endonuclease Cas3 [Verrucomicrobiota bacterium JB025]